MIMSHQRLVTSEAEEEGNNGSSNVNHRENCTLTPLLPVSSFEVAELTWENGQLAMHELGGIFPLTKPTWGRATDTLESLVHQATFHKPNQCGSEQGQTMEKAVGSVVASTGGKCGEDSGCAKSSMGLKRMRSDADNGDDEWADRSACASANAALRRETNTPLVIWSEFDSPRSHKSKNADEDSGYGGSESQEVERETKSEPSRSHTGRRGRAAASHNQSERRRRDRINQKMKALQKLVPNASKTDKASMLDEVIEYLKQLQAQVQMMSAGNMSIMMPIGMQQPLQMSLLGMGLGLGMGMGMLDMSNLPRSAPQQLPHILHPSLATPTSNFVAPQFVLPPTIPQPSSDPGNCSSAPLPDPYSKFLAHSMSMDLYNKIAALYGQQANQTAQAAYGMPQSNNVQGA